MAIVSDFLGSKLVTQLNYGMVNGKELIKKKSYPAVREEATNEAIHAVGVAIATLQAPTLEEVRRIDEFLLTDV